MTASLCDLARVAGATAAVAALAGCMVLPRTTTQYNATCGTTERRVVLEAQQVGQLGACHGQVNCAGLLAAYGIVASASLVVSGTVAVVGNVVFWAERLGQCPGPVAPGSAASSAA